MRSASSTSAAADRLEHLLRHNRDLHGAERSDPVFAERLRALQSWQSERLLETHADLAAHPRYAEGVTFFVRDLYAPRDFSARDADIEQALPYMRHLLPERVLETAAGAMDLYVLTRALDADMVTALFETLGVERIDAAAYAEAYRVCDAYEDRARQIELIAALASRLDRYVRSRLVLTTLRLARTPAHLAGLGALQDFLERGFGAFHRMGGSEAFVDTIVRREMRILDRIFERHPEPFAVV